MIKVSPKFALPFLGAAGFLAGCELSLRQPGRFWVWSLAAVAWTLGVFAVLTYRGRFQRHFLAVAIPAVLMIAVSTTASLLFVDLKAPSRWVFYFYALVLYLFLEHVRHDAEDSSHEERRYLAEYGRMVNVGSLFLLAATARGLTIFLSWPWWASVLAMAAVALAWSWHLHLACTENCGQPLFRTLVTATVVVEACLVVMWLPVTIFVGGATVTLAYYLAFVFLSFSPADPAAKRRARRYAVVGFALGLLILATARWFA